MIYKEIETKVKRDFFWIRILQLMYFNQNKHMKIKWYYMYTRKI